MTQAVRAYARHFGKDQRCCAGSFSPQASETLSPKHSITHKNTTNPSQNTPAQPSIKDQPMVTKANQTDASRITSIPLQPRNHHRCCKENMTTDNTNPFPRRLGGRLKPCLGADLEQTRAYAAHEKAKIPKTNPFSHRWASFPQQTDGPPVSC